MKIGKKGLELIKKYEGFYSKPYLDPIGIPTIGYGATYYPNKVKVTMKDKPLTEKQASDLLVQMLKVYENQVALLVRKPITQNQFDALVSLSYNIGSGAFKNSTLLKKLNAKDYAGAADQFLVWNKGGGKVLKGLVRRRDAERALFLKK